MNGNPYQEPDEQPDVASGQAPLGNFAIQALIAIAILTVLAALLLPATRRGGGEASRRTQCRNQLKNVALALYSYHDVYDTFPPAYTVDANGNPLHSWRTLILPFADQQHLYDTIALDKPWDHPANSAAHDSSVDMYACPSVSLRPGHTTYLGNASPGGCFQPGASMSIADFHDGTSNTLLVIEASSQNSVHWMSPEDDMGNIFQQLNEDTDTSHVGGCQAVLADGSCRFLSATTSMETRQALLTIAGGETIGEF